MCSASREVVSSEKNIQKEFLEETVKFLSRYSWPGNIRELEHEVKRAMVLAPGPHVTPFDIHETIRGAIEKSAIPGSSEC